MANKYREYFDIDEEYFPQINDYSIAAAKPDFWMTTYPHQPSILYRHAKKGLVEVIGQARSKRYRQIISQERGLRNA